MSYAANNWAKKARTGSTTRKAVLLVLADYADPWGWTFIGTRTLHEDAEIGERHVFRVVQQLAADGWIRVFQKRDQLGRSTNLYQLLFDAAPKDPLPSDHKSRDGDYRLKYPEPKEREPGAPAPDGMPGDNVSPGPGDRPGDIRSTSRVTSDAIPGDSAMSPKPLNVREPTGTSRAREALDQLKAVFPGRHVPEPDGPALELLEALLGEGVALDVLEAAARVYRRQVTESGEIGGRFVVTLARWLGERRFNAYTSAAPGAGSAADCDRLPSLPAPVAEGAEAWERVRGRLRAEMGVAAFKTWLQAMSWQGVVDGAPRLVVATAAHRDWIEQRARRRLDALCAAEDLAAPVLLTVAAWRDGADVTEPTMATDGR